MEWGSFTLGLVTGLLFAFIFVHLVVKNILSLNNKEEKPDPDDWWRGKND